jgi:hypothetical protein
MGVFTSTEYKTLLFWYELYFIQKKYRLSIMKTILIREIYLKIFSTLLAGFFHEKFSTVKLNSLDLGLNCV